MTSVMDTDCVRAPEVATRNGIGLVTSSDFPNGATVATRNAGRLAELEVVVGQGRSVQDDSRQRWQRAHASAKSCAHCGDCGREFDPGEPVTLTKIRCGYNGLGMFIAPQAPVCDACAPSRPWSESGPCEGCGRSVTVHRGLWADRHFHCSTKCQFASQARRRKETRARSRGGMTCEVCAEPFEPARSDARYCSSACRQDAYRKRKIAGAE
jgi:hypothetical protein